MVIIIIFLRNPTFFLCFQFSLNFKSLAQTQGTNKVVGETIESP